MLLVLRLGLFFSFLFLLNICLLSLMHTTGSRSSGLSKMTDYLIFAKTAVLRPLTITCLCQRHYSSAHAWLLCQPEQMWTLITLFSLLNQCYAKLGVWFLGLVEFSLTIQPSCLPPSFSTACIHIFPYYLLKI